MFDQFYRLKSWSDKTSFLRSCVKRCEMKPNRNPIISLKNRRFFSRYEVKDEKGNFKRVCAHFLTNLLQISRVKLFRSAASITSNPLAIDRRGKFSSRKVKFCDIEFAKQFIQRFPQYESKFRQFHSSKKYLHPSLNLRKLYGMYRTECTNNVRTILSETYFRKVFKKFFSLAFLKYSKSACSLCCNSKKLLKSQVIDVHFREQLQKKMDEHVAILEKTKSDLLSTVQNATDILQHTEVFTFALQRALDLPSMSSNEALCKRSMWYFNLTVFDEIRKRGYMYTWPESVASHGSQEIASCLIRHMIENLPSDTESVIFYSGANKGQTRNMKLSLMLIKFFDLWQDPDLKFIEQRFFSSGHTYSSCSRCFDMIDKQRKQTENVFLPSDWVEIIEDSKRCIPKFTVKEMHSAHFFSSESLEQLLNSTKSTAAGLKINWHQIQAIQYTRSESFTLRVMKISEKDVPFRTISLDKRVPVYKFGNVELSLLYPQGREITKAKYEDLQSLLNLIPSEHHAFYRNLKYQNTSDHDMGLAVRESSDEDEDDENLTEIV